PKGVHAHVLAAYAVQRGRQAYEAALADPEACARLAQRPGLISLSGSLFGFEEVLARALARAADAEIDAFVREVAVRDTRDLTGGPRDRSVLNHPRFGPGVVIEEAG